MALNEKSEKDTPPLKNNHQNSHVKMSNRLQGVTTSYRALPSWCPRDTNRIQQEHELTIEIKRLLMDKHERPREQ